MSDVSRPLVAVGEVQKRGMTVVMGPHGSFVTRGQVVKPPGSNLKRLLDWMRLTRGERVLRLLRRRAYIRRPE